MATFLEAYAKVKAAVAPNESSHLSHVCIRDGMMFATDSRMTAAAEVDFEEKFMVPAREFYQALTVLGEKDLKLAVKENKIVVSKSRRRVTIETLNPDEFVYNLPEGDPLPVPKALVQAFRAVHKFMSDDRTKAWANAVRIKDGHVFATNNIVVACAPCGNWSKEIDITIPDWVIEYIISREVELQYISFNDHSVSFNWGDNSWVRSRRLTQEMPDMVVDIIGKIEEPAFELSDDWKDAYNTVRQLSDDVIRIFPDKIAAGKGHAKIEAEVTSPVEEETIWHPRYMSLVVEQATHFDPKNWPNPCSWKGPLCRGLIIGRRT